MPEHPIEIRHQIMPNQQSGILRAQGPEPRQTSDGIGDLPLKSASLKQGVRAPLLA
jgi:hypothetical protein